MRGNLLRGLRGGLFSGAFNFAMGGNLQDTVVGAGAGTLGFALGGPVRIWSWSWSKFSCAKFRKI